MTSGSDKQNSQVQSNNFMYNWVYQVGEKKFSSKLLAINHSNQTSKPIYFNCPQDYNTYDFSNEPKESLQVLFKNQAQKIRDSYKTVRLYFSGGSDSHLILRTFLDNNIPIDEIICLKSGFASADFEIDNYAIPILKKLDLKNTKVHINCPSLETYYKYYKEGVTAEKIQNSSYTYHTHFRLQEAVEYHSEKNYNPLTANMRGFDKSTIIYKDGHWYTYFLDVNLEPFPHMINFFSDDTKIQSKQAHKWKRVVETLTDKQGNKTHNFQDKEIQMMWNQATGRIYETPLKDCFYDKGDNHILIDNKKWYYRNFKEKYAFESVMLKNKELLYLWQSNLQDLAKYTGNHWWNQGSPELGSIGILSKFYCLTKNQTKTVDELYPNGFKP